MERIAPLPWTAPSAGVYAADGLLVCTLGTPDVVKAYRQRGDTDGAMVADHARLIAAAPALLRELQGFVNRWSKYPKPPTGADLDIYLDSAREVIAAAEPCIDLYPHESATLEGPEA